jgi:hypothetical protein
VVTVRGTERAIASLTIQSVEAYVDVRALSAGDHVAEVQVRPDQGLTVDEIAPASVRLRIAKP